MQIPSATPVYRRRMTKAEKMRYMKDAGIIDTKKFTLLHKHDTLYTKLKKLLKVVPERK